MKNVWLIATILLCMTKNIAGKLPPLDQWTARCLSKYDERFDGSRFSGTSILNGPEFDHILKLFFQKINTISMFKNFNTPEQNPNSLSQDFKYPYVSKIDAAPGTIAIFIGDLHGSLHSLLRNLWRLVALGYLDKNFNITKKNIDLVFLGDYVDRGRYGAEVLYTLLRLKCANWKNVYLVRGNHEVQDMNERLALDGGGFWHELQTKYPKTAPSLFSQICALYQYLPLAVYISSNNQTIMAAHAGFGPYSYYYDTSKKDHRIQHIQLKKEDLVAPAFQWCDIVQKTATKTHHHFIPDPNRVWSIDVQGLMAALSKSNNRALFRGHQHSSFGLKMLFSPKIASTLSLDMAQEQYHWTKVIEQTYPTDLVENNTQGFQVDHYVPIFTFSSSPEGVLEPYDCFGLLGMDGPFDQWRLKVYEFKSPLHRARGEKTRFYTTLYKNFHQAPKSTSGMPDVIWPKFSTHVRSERKITHELQQICSLS